MRKRTATISIGVALIVGAMIGGSGNSDATPAPKVETRTVTNVVTPQACRDLIDTDNDLFNHISTGLSQYPDLTALDTTTQYIKDQTPTRQAQVRDCEAS